MMTITNCRFCGQSHGLRCPSVKAIEYFEDGVTVKRVEFVTAADYSTSYANPDPNRHLPSNPVPWPYTSTTWGAGDKPSELIGL